MLALGAAFLSSITRAGVLEWNVVAVCQSFVLLTAALKVLMNVAVCYGDLVKGISHALRSQKRHNCLLILSKEESQAEERALEEANERIEVFMDEIESLPVVKLGGALPLTTTNLLKIAGIALASTFSTLVRMQMMDSE